MGDQIIANVFSSFLVYVLMKEDEIVIKMLIAIFPLLYDMMATMRNTKSKMHISVVFVACLHYLRSRTGLHKCLVACNV